MTTDYTKVFQDAEAVEKYETVTYAPDSYASRINERQRAYLRELVVRQFGDRRAGAARLRLRHRPGDPYPARAGPRGARLRHVGGDDGQGGARSARTRTGTRCRRTGRCRSRWGRYAGHRDDVPAAAQCGRGDPGPGAGVRGQGAAGRGRRGCWWWRTTATRARYGTCGPGGTPAKRWFAELSHEQVGDAAGPARLRDRRAARLLDAHPVAARRDASRGPRDAATRRAARSSRVAVNVLYTARAAR